MTWKILIYVIDISMSCHVKAIWYPSDELIKMFQFSPDIVSHNIITYTFSWTYHIHSEICWKMSWSLFAFFMYNKMNLHIINKIYVFQRKYLCRTHLSYRSSKFILVILSLIWWRRCNIIFFLCCSMKNFMVYVGFMFLLTISVYQHTSKRMLECVL